MSIQFGDDDAEDSWDPDDPVEELLENLARRVVAILVARAFDQHRFEMLRDDLGHIAARVRDGDLC